MAVNIVEGCDIGDDLQLSLLFPDYDLPPTLKLPVLSQTLFESFKKSNYRELLKSSVALDFFEYLSKDSKNIKEILIHLPKRLNLFLVSNNPFDVLILGAACLQAFVQENWTGPGLKLNFTDIIKLDSNYPTEVLHKDCLALLEKCGESCYRLVTSPFLLLLAEALLEPLLPIFSTAGLWRARAFLFHQRMLEHNVQSFRDIYFGHMESALSSSWIQKIPCRKELTILLLLECVCACYQYNDVTEAQTFLEKAKALNGLNLRLTGFLGKRTKYQSAPLPQLTLLVENNKSCAPEEPGHRPQEVALESDTLYSSVCYEEEIPHHSLGLYDQLIVLAACVNVKNTNPVHGLTADEMFPYVNRVLEEKNNNNWMICSFALLLRSRLEAKHMKKAERAALQLQVLVDQFEDTKYGDGPVSERIKFIYALAFPPKHSLRRELGYLLLSMGCSRSARELFEGLELWGDVVKSHIISGETEKALAVIRCRLALEDSPLMRCYLGDITGDHSEYETAWETSGHRYTRAMRSLGRHYLKAGQHERCIECFQTALNINPIFPRGLGCAAMFCKRWPLAASAFRHALSLDRDNAEAWSNLGAVLTKLEEINGAQTAYKEGLKCNRSHWRIWENLLTVSLQLEDVCTCLEAVSEIVNLRTKWDNLPQLTLLLDLIMQRVRQYEGNSVDWRTLTEKTSQMLECIGNVGITDPCFWLLCAEWHSFLGVWDKEVDFLLRAYRALSASSWEHDENLFEKLAESVLRLSKVYSAAAGRLYCHKAVLLLRGLLRKAENAYTEHVLYSALQDELKRITQLESVLKQEER